MTAAHAPSAAKPDVLNDVAAWAGGKAYEVAVASGAARAEGNGLRSLATVGRSQSWSCAREEPWLYGCLIVSKFCKVYVNCWVQEPPGTSVQVATLANLLVAMNAMATPETGAVRVNLHQMSVAVADGGPFLAAVLGKRGAHLDSLELCAVQVAHAFNKVFGTSLEKKVELERTDSARRMREYTVQDEKQHDARASSSRAPESAYFDDASEGGGSAPEDDSYEPFQREFLRPTLAQPPFSSAWLGQLASVAGVARVYLVDPRRRSPVLLTEGAVPSLEVSSKFAASMTANGPRPDAPPAAPPWAVPGLHARDVAGPSGGALWRIVLDHCLVLVDALEAQERRERLNKARDGGGVGAKKAVGWGGVVDPALARILSSSVGEGRQRSFLSSPHDQHLSQAHNSGVLAAHGQSHPSALGPQFQHPQPPPRSSNPTHPQGGRMPQDSLSPWDVNGASIGSASGSHSLTVTNAIPSGYGAVVTDGSGYGVVVANASNSNMHNSTNHQGDGPKATSSTSTGLAHPTGVASHPTKPPPAPRTVMLAFVAWDPCVSVVVRSVPLRPRPGCLVVFCEHGPREARALRDHVLLTATDASTNNIRGVAAGHSSTNGTPGAPDVAPAPGPLHQPLATNGTYGNGGPANGAANSAPVTPVANRRGSDAPDSSSHAGGGDSTRSQQMGASSQVYLSDGSSRGATSPWAGPQGVPAGPLRSSRGRGLSARLMAWLGGGRNRPLPPGVAGARTAPGNALQFPSVFQGRVSSDGGFGDDGWSSSRGAGNGGGNRGGNSNGGGIPGDRYATLWDEKLIPPLLLSRLNRVTLTVAQSFDGWPGGSVTGGGDASAGGTGAGGSTKGVDASSSSHASTTLFSSATLSSYSGALASSVVGSSSLSMITATSPSSSAAVSGSDLAMDSDVGHPSSEPPTAMTTSVGSVASSRKQAHARGAWGPRRLSRDHHDDLLADDAHASISSGDGKAHASGGDGGVDDVSAHAGADRGVDGSHSSPNPSAPSKLGPKKLSAPAVQAGGHPAHKGGREHDHPKDNGVTDAGDKGKGGPRVPRLNLQVVQMHTGTEVAQEDRPTPDTRLVLSLDEEGEEGDGEGQAGSGREGVRRETSRDVGVPVASRGAGRSSRLHPGGGVATSDSLNSGTAAHRSGVVNAGSTATGGGLHSPPAKAWGPQDDADVRGAGAAEAAPSKVGLPGVAIPRLNLTGVAAESSEPNYPDWAHRSSSMGEESREEEGEEGKAQGRGEGRGQGRGQGREEGRREGRREGRGNESEDLAERPRGREDDRKQWHQKTGAAQAHQPDEAAEQGSGEWGGHPSKPRGVPRLDLGAVPRGDPEYPSWVSRGGDASSSGDDEKDGSRGDGMEDYGRGGGDDYRGDADEVIGDEKKWVCGIVGDGSDTDGYSRPGEGVRAHDGDGRVGGGRVGGNRDTGSASGDGGGASGHIAAHHGQVQGGRVSEADSGVAGGGGWGAAPPSMSSWDQPTPPAHKPRGAFVQRPQQRLTGPAPVASLPVALPGVGSAGPIAPSHQEDDLPQDLNVVAQWAVPGQMDAGESEGLNDPSDGAKLTRPLSASPPHHAAIPRLSPPMEAMGTSGEGDKEGNVHVGEPAEVVVPHPPSVGRSQGGRQRPLQLKGAP
eukprot:jgi/Mesvir1/5442/Mv15501-RA.1